MYPDENDPVAAFAAIAQQLAELLDSRVKIVESGSFTIALTANTTIDKTVTFAQPFTAPPNVIAIPQDAAPETIFISLKQTPTAISCIFRCRRTTTANGKFYWFAHG
jgi:hypothetical protein